MHTAYLHAHSWIPRLSTMWHFLIEYFPVEHIHNLWRDWICLNNKPSPIPPNRLSKTSVSLFHFISINFNRCDTKRNSDS